MSAPTETWVYHVDPKNGPQHVKYYLSVLSPDMVSPHRLPNEAILGELIHGPDRIEAESFQPNPIFPQFLGWVITKHAAEIGGLVAEAKRQQNGYVYVIDGRVSDPEGAVPPEDIIGGVEVERGELIRYHGNPNYRAFGTLGLMSLDAEIHRKLIEELTWLAKRPQ